MKGSSKIPVFSAGKKQQKDTKGNSSPRIRTSSFQGETNRTVNGKQSMKSKPTNKNQNKLKDGDRARTPSPLKTYRVENPSDILKGKATRSRSLSPHSKDSLKLSHHGANRERSPSPRRTERIASTAIPAVAPINPREKRVTLDEEDEFLRLEKLCAEEEKVPVSNGEVKTVQRTNGNFIVEEITEEIHEPNTVIEISNSIDHIPNGKYSVSKDKKTVSPRRSLPYTPVSRASESTTLISSSSYVKQNGTEVPFNDTHNHEITTAKVQPCFSTTSKVETPAYVNHNKNGSSDNNFIKKVDRASIECGPHDVNMKHNNGDLKMREIGLNREEIPLKERLTYLRQEFTTIEDKGDDSCLEDVINSNDTEMDNRELSVKVDNKAQYMSDIVKSPISKRKIISNADENIINNSINTNIRMTSAGKKDDYKVLEDHFELDEVLERPSNESEVRMEERFPSPEVDLEHGTIDFYAYDEITYDDKDEGHYMGVENMEDVNLSSSANTGKRSNKWDHFPSYYINDEALLTDIEEENTADLAQTASTMSHTEDLESVVDDDWERETLISDSKRSSLDSVSYPPNTRFALSNSINENVYPSGTVVPNNSDMKHTHVSKRHELKMAQKSADDIKTVLKDQKNHLENFTTTCEKDENLRIHNNQPSSQRVLPKAPGQNAIIKEQIEMMHTSSPFELLDDDVTDGDKKRPSKTDQNTASLKCSEIVEIIDYNTECMPPDNIGSQTRNHIGYCDTRTQKDVNSISKNQTIFKPIEIGTVRPLEDENVDLKLSSRHSLAFGELNPIKIDCVKLCPAKTLPKERRDSEDSGHFEYDTTERVRPAELEDVKLELQKMNTNITGLQKELHEAKEKVIRLRGGLAMIRQNRLLWKKCIQGN